jgi:hypothetical protein
MNLMMRLYRQHDLDLISLFYDPNFLFKKAVKDVLASYVRGTYYRIQIPHVPITVEHVNKVIPFHISLDDEEDADIIEWLNGVTNGNRNSFIKNLFRAYAVGVNMIPYYDGKNGGEIFVANTEDIRTFEPDPKKKKKRKPKKQKADIINLTKPASVKGETPEEEIGVVDMLDDFDALMNSF